MGGMQALEWAVMYPRRVRSLVAIATCMQATAQQIAWGAIGRRAIRLDPKWRGGDYYDAEPGDGPTEGLAIARMVAQVTFRSDNVFTDRFGRELADKTAVGDTLGDVAAVRGRALPRVPRREAGPPVRHQQLPGDRQGHGPPRRRPRPRLAGSGDAAGDGADAGGRDLERHALPGLPAAADPQTLVANGVPSEYVEIDSPHGHDAFLINSDQLDEPIERFLAAVAKSDA